MIPPSMETRQATPASATAGLPLFNRKPEAWGPGFEKWVHTATGREIADKFIRIAVRLLNMGHRHFSADAVAHYVRINFFLEHGPDTAGFKINNNHISGLARFAESREPRLVGVFEHRQAVIR